MANDTQTGSTLGRRFLEAGGKWAPGMRVYPGGLVVIRPRDHLAFDIDFGHTVSFTSTDEPDLRHPSTLGCVLAQVREAYNDPTLTVEVDPKGRVWAVVARSTTGYYLIIRGTGPTEAEALVAALEASRHGGG